MGIHRPRRWLVRTSSLVAAILLAVTSFTLLATPASASSWSGAGEYEANTTFVDTYAREYPDGITLSDVRPGAHIQVLAAPSGSYVYARIMGNSRNGDAVNLCAYIRFSPDSSGQNAYFNKVSGATSSYQSTCPNTPLDSGNRVPASRYAQSRSTALNEGNTQGGCTNNTEHGYDNYWYSGYLSNCGFIAGVPTTTHGACPLYRTHDWTTNYDYGTAFPRSVQSGDEIRVRFFTPDGSHVMVDLRYAAGADTVSEWGFISASCLTDSRF